MSTSAVENEIIAFLSTAHFELLREYIFFSVAMALSCAIIPVFVVWRFHERGRTHKREGTPYKTYTHKDTAPLAIHTTIMIIIPALVVREMYFCLRATRSSGEIVFCALIILLAVFAVTGLHRCRVFGLLSAWGFVVCFAAFKQYHNLSAVMENMQGMGQYTTINQYVLYIVDDYIVTESMFWSFVALAVLTLLAVYYYRRRFLFMPGKLGGPFCEHCGQVIGKRNRFCTCCGKQLPLNLREPAIVSLDRKPYCGQCGFFSRDSVCIRCRQMTLEDMKEMAKEQLGKRVRSIIRGLLFGVMVVVLILLGSGSLATDLYGGSARVNNAFVEKWNEFYDNPDRASDSEWLAGFDSAATALYLADARWKSVKPRSVRSSGLVFFGEYVNASFRQMKILEQCVEIAHIAARGEMSADEIHADAKGLQEELNKTADLQESALEYYDTGGFADFFQYYLNGKFGYFCFDGVRALLPWVSTMKVSLVVIIGCILMLVFMLNGFCSGEITRLEQRLQKARAKAEIRHGKYPPVHFPVNRTDLLHRMALVLKNCWVCLIRFASELGLLFFHIIAVFGLFFSLMSPQNLAGCISWVKAGLTDVKGINAGLYGAYKREQRRIFAVGIVIFVAIAGIYSFCANKFSMLDGGPGREEKYLLAAETAVSKYSVDISKVLLAISGTRNLTEAEKEVFYGLIDMQVAADEEMISYDMAGLDDYQGLHIGLQSLCRDDIATLKRVKQAIEGNMVFSEELKRNYVSLRSENYLWVITDVAQELFELIIIKAVDMVG